jgi:hypothetical protein
MRHKDERRSDVRALLGTTITSFSEKATPRIGLAILALSAQHGDMARTLSTIGQMRFRPDSRALGRGSLGDAIDGRSREGKFIRRVEAELIEQLGGKPTFSQMLLVRRAARAALKLELYDRKLADGDINGHDSRMYGGLSNNLRLLLREIASQASAKSSAKTLDLDAIIARNKGAAP